MTRPDLAVAQVQIGPADAAGMHAQAQLPRPRFRHGDLGGAQWRARTVEQHRAHQPYPCALIAIYADAIDQFRTMNSPSSHHRPLFPRSVRPLIVEGLDDSRIVFVGGARQVGKMVRTSRTSRSTNDR